MLPMIQGYKLTSIVPLVRVSPVLPMIQGYELTSIVPLLVFSCVACDTRLQVNKYCTLLVFSCVAYDTRLQVNKYCTLAGVSPVLSVIQGYKLTSIVPLLRVSVWPE